MISPTRVSATTAWILVLLCSWWLAQVHVRAEDCPAGASPKTCPAPLFSKALARLPYLNQRVTAAGVTLWNDLAQELTVADKPCSSEERQFAASEGFERTGAERSFSPFDWLWSQAAGGECGHCVADSCRKVPSPDQLIIFTPSAAACSAAGCAVCRLPHDTGVAQASCATVQEHEAGARTVAGVPGAACAGDSCAGAHESAGCRSRIERLIAENAALTVALEASDEFFELRSKMLEEMLGLVVQKIQLETRLAVTEKLFAEREKIHREAAELMAENARLKSLTEVMEARHAAEKVELEMAVENERLKQRVAQLEQAQAHPGGARTAKRAAAGKKPL